MRFRILDDFTYEGLKSDYLAGLTYTIRPGNELLAALVPQWVAEGKAEWLDDSAPKSQVSAKGTVA